MCVDYRKLNRKLIPHRFSLPRMEDIIDRLGKSKFFSTLDLASGFHQIPLHENSRKYTAFSTDNGMFQWKVLPFGLSIAPSGFSRMMALAFAGLSPERCFSYMDDLIVIGYSEENHIQNLREIFKTCRKYNLKLNPLKCHFFQSEVGFLGHVCTDKGLRPDPTKLKVMENYPRPANKDAIRRFVAFANYYRRFVDNFAKITQPLTKLTRKRAKFIWSTEQEEAFQSLRNALTSAPILKYPDFSREFTLVVDASQFACGGVLTQKCDEIDMPIAYISKSFKKGELNKPPIEKELLAVHFAIMQFKPYIYGKHFKVKSDHKPLIYLYNLKNPSSRLSRIRLDLEEFDFEIIYIKGKDNVVADALSRISIDELKELYGNVSVFAITRSMTEKQNKIPPQNVDIDCSNIKVYEDFATKFSRTKPNIKTLSINVDKNKGSIQNIELQIHKSKVKICTIKFNLSEANLKNMFEEIERAASARNIEIMQISLSDGILKVCTLERFKSAGNEALQKLKIIILKPRITVNDPKQRLAIVKQFHDDPLFGGHTGPNKLFAKIRNNYFWKNMTFTFTKVY